MNKIRHLLFLPLWLMLTFSTVVQAQPVPEYVLKATYLFNFMVYTEWTDAASAKPQSLYLCVLGQDNFGMALSRLEEKTINGANIVVSRLKGMSGIKKCHLLFVTDREAGKASHLRRDRDEVSCQRLLRLISQLSRLKWEAGRQYGCHLSLYWKCAHFDGRRFTDGL